MKAIDLFQHESIINKKELLARYTELAAENASEYCLVAISLKDFSEYLHRVGQDTYIEVINVFFEQVCPLLNSREFIAHFHYDYFVALIECEHSIDALHIAVAPLHFAVRDGMQKKFGLQIFLALGFYPLTSPVVNFYDACYFADLCRKGPHYHFKETNYDMYGLSYVDRVENFRRMESSVQNAMDNGHFKLYLQPKVNVATGEVTSAEALVRWDDPKRGMIPLSDFLPNMEDNGFIRDLDCYLFDIACSYLDKWYNIYGKKINISFNLNKAYFNGPFFMPEYTAVFDKYNFPPECVRIELLESIVLDDLERLEPLVKDIYDYGFSCSLDDFGSGFSSFSVLTSVRLSELKIDRSLFRDNNNPKEHLLIKHIVEIGHDMGMTCVAEGVETKEYVDYLQKIGCDYIQGFYYHHPMPVDVFESKFITNNT